MLRACLEVPSRWSATTRRSARRRLAAVLATAVLATSPREVRADEGGVGFWAPGQFASLAAVPTQPGWSLPVAYYHASGDAGTERRFVVGGQVTAGLEADANLVFLFPTYTFAERVLGAQAAVALGWVTGHVAVTAEVAATGPEGAIVRTRRADRASGGGDLYGLGTLKWATGPHHVLAYAMAGAPVGAWRAGRLANLGTNHWSIDAGGGYTWLDAARGYELSIVAGATYNFENDATDYRNGVDAHLEWALSQFLHERLHVGVAGYAYRQLTGDRGRGAVLGDFKSRVNGVGPQAGWIFPAGRGTGYASLRAYREFGARHRVEGWTAWLSVSVPLAAFLQ